MQRSIVLLPEPDEPITLIDVAGVRLQRNTFENFVIAVLFVKFVDEELLLRVVHRGHGRA